MAIVDGGCVLKPIFKFVQVRCFCCCFRPGPCRPLRQHRHRLLLLPGGSDAAVAGGINIMLEASTTAGICQLQALSPVGRCRSFDASGDGYGRGEGFVAAVMQRHDPAAARRHSASICGLLLGSAVNQAGRSSGLTAPNGPSQSSLLRATLAAAGLASSELRFLSVHGTGTALGDPIEVGALAQALPGSSRARGGSSSSSAEAPRIPLTLASNKACYGHTEGAAGLTGLLLAAGMDSHQAAPAIMHLRSMNPYVQAALGDWGAAGGRALHLPRQFAAGSAASAAPGAAGTSSFGMSGVNAHMLVEAWRSEPDGPQSAENQAVRTECSVPMLNVFCKVRWKPDNTLLPPSLPPDSACRRLPLSAPATGAPPRCIPCCTRAPAPAAVARWCSAVCISHPWPT